ncbi:MAG: hypothetical protein V4850_23090 [Myxococcota bacterium]
MKPPQEARPIQFEWLGGPQRRAIDDIHASLLAIVQENREAHQPNEPVADDPWAMVDTRRSNRALFVDGPRGMGKSAVLVTLLHGWRQAADGQPASWSAFEPGAKEAEATFAPLADLVRALPIRDFTPLADHIPLRAWLLQSFHDLAQRADGDQTKASRGRVVQKGTEHADAWGDLFKKAVAGWESVRTPARAAIEQIVDHRLQIRSSYDFGQQFQRFLDGVLASAHERGVLPSQDTVLVVTIDDLDLQVDRVRELLDAIRLLHHPRLVWLCAGDWRLLVHAVADDFEGAALHQLGTHRRSKVHASRAKSLARAVCTKTFPNPLPLRKLSLGEILAAEEGRCTRVLDTLRTKPDAGEEPLGTWLGALAEADPAPLLTWRELRHRLDATPARPERHHALALLRTILDPEDRRTDTLGRRPGKGPSGWVDYREDVEIRAESPRERSWNLLGGGRVNIARRVRFSGGPRARLALSLAAATSDVKARGVTMDYGPILAWTTLPGALVWWPWVDRPYSPVDLLRMAESWAFWVDCAAANGRGVDALVYGWIALQGKLEPEMAVLEEDVLVEGAAWQALVGRVGKSTDPAVGRWAETSLPIFAAPEFGMSDRAAEALARACAAGMLLDGDANLSVLVDIWHSNRRRIFLPDAVGQARDAEARRAGTTVTEPWPTEADALPLDRALQSARPDSPWYHLRDPEGWWLGSPVIDGFLRWLRAKPRRAGLFEYERGRATLAGRMFGRGLRVPGLTLSAQLLTQVDGGLAAVVTAYRHLAAMLCTRVGTDPEGQDWRALAKQVELRPGGRGVRVRPAVRLEHVTELVGGGRPYHKLTAWQIEGLAEAPDVVRVALAAWLGLLQNECASDSLPMDGFSWSAPTLLVLGGEPLPLPPFPRWADVQLFASAWEARHLEFETAPMSEESRTEWLVVAYLDLAITLFSGAWIDQWRERTQPGYRNEPIHGNWNVMGAGPASSELVAWVRAIQTGQTYLSLPEDYRKAFLTNDSRFSGSR